LTSVEAGAIQSRVDELRAHALRLPDGFFEDSSSGTSKY
jgi:hypothetical protein